MSEKKTEDLHFDVSSGLKSVLGSELITDDEVAIFELVKNSFDAGAAHVELYFDSNQIVISDDGIGMTMDDIKKRWLFVGYSAKREQNRPRDFRDTIEGRKRYAGSKGVGRISSDRLGKLLTLQTRSKDKISDPVHSIKVDWSLFDKNHLKRFESIGVVHSEQSNGFIMPSGMTKNRHGTVISIEPPRKVWDRDSLKNLKAALSKLINPFGSTADGFTISILAPAENDADKLAVSEARKNGVDFVPTDVVNGAVGNFIFSTLQEKTTFISVHVDESGDYIESTLIDRGELIYKIREPNAFQRLSKSGFRCEVYFLNYSAKSTFTRRMGVPSVQFGSVFLFRNGFRVFPIGEWNDDWFGMERRKGQGYARYLGARDVIGRIDVEGSDEDFKEASSRNTGLIETAAVIELRTCFMKQCLQRLEKYVVPVTFVDTEDKYSDDVSRLATDPGKARVAEVVANLVNSRKIELLDYSRNLIGILSERSQEFESSLTSLRVIAERTKDKELFKRVEAAEKRFEELKLREEAARRQADEERQAKEAARKQADEERQAKEVAQARAAKAEAAEQLTKAELEEEKKRNLFLTSIATLDTDTILNLHHQITIYAVDIQQQIQNLSVSVSGKKVVEVHEVLDSIEGIALLNSKVLGVAKFATKANFRMQSEKIKAHLGEYIEQYVNGIAQYHRPSGLRKITVSVEGKGFEQQFNPINIAVVIDNLIVNARKADATRIDFRITHPHPGSVYINVTDNGHGFKNKMLSRIFEKGFTTTDGSGLGLYHVRQVLGEMSGTIDASENAPKGAAFLIKISK
jgi:signal transduction histidine kinase